MFRVPEDIALKMVTKRNYFLKKTFISFYKPLFQTGPTKNSKKCKKNREKLQHFGLKNS